MHVKINRWLASVALVLASFLMLVVIVFGAGFISGLRDAATPTVTPPAATSEPWGFDCVPVDNTTVC